MREVIKLPVRRTEGRPMVEAIEVERNGDGTVRLLFSPGIVEGLAAGDVIEVVSGSTEGFRVVSRGGNVCVWYFFEHKKENSGPAAERLRKAVELIGGRIDGGGVYTLVVTVPVSARLSRIADVFDDIAQNTPGATWMFGNIYDPLDGKTPLKWWPASAE